MTYGIGYFVESQVLFNDYFPPHVAMASSTIGRAEEFKFTRFFRGKGYRSHSTYL